MYDTIYRQLEQFATWPVVSLLFVLFINCVHLFTWRQKKLGYDNPALDSRFWYSPDDARKFFDGIGLPGRRLYGITELTLDIAFPLIYGTLFAALLIHLYGDTSARAWVLVVPMLNVAADLLENTTVACLALRFKGQASSVAKVAAIFTAVKFVLFLLSLSMIAVGALMMIGRSELALFVLPLLLILVGAWKIWRSK